MTPRSPFRERALMCAGLMLMALRSTLQTLVDRSGHSTATTDFALGLMMGLGIAMTLLAIWRNGRRQRGETTTCNK